VGKINGYDKIMIENQKKRKKYLSIKDGIRMELAACQGELMPEGGADIIYHM